MVFHCLFASACWSRRRDEDVASHGRWADYHVCCCSWPVADIAQKTFEEMILVHGMISDFSLIRDSESSANPPIHWYQEENP